jgi:hypothetical protein
LHATRLAGTANQAPKQRAEKGSKKAAQHVNAPLLLILPGFSDFIFLNMATIAIPTEEDVISTFPELSALLRAALRPLPAETGDHAYLQEKPDQNLVDQLKAVNLENAGTIKDVITRLGGRPTDDKTYIMERMIRLASQLPRAAPAGTCVTNSFLTQL